VALPNNSVFTTEKDMEKEYVFGNFNDWGFVLEQLEKLSDSRELGNYQEQLIGLLRFDQNWRLREAAIESLPFVEKPGLDIVREVTSLIKRKELYYDVRILATEGLQKLVATIVKNKAFDNDILKQFIHGIVEEMDDLLASPEPPKFHDALQNARVQFNRI
jgi:hypothetical protein